MENAARINKKCQRRRINKMSICFSMILSLFITRKNVTAIKCLTSINLSYVLLIILKFPDKFNSQFLPSNTKMRNASCAKHKLPLKKNHKNAKNNTSKRWKKKRNVSTLEKCRLILVILKKIHVSVKKLIMNMFNRK